MANNSHHNPDRTEGGTERDVLQSGANNRRPLHLPHIKAEASDLEKNTVYMGTITGVESYGVFVTFTPGKENDLDSLVHISRLPGPDPEAYTVGELAAVELKEFRDDGDIGARLCYSEHTYNPNGYEFPDVLPQSPNRKEHGRWVYDDPVDDTESRSTETLKQMLDRERDGRSVQDTGSDGNFNIEAHKLLLDRLVASGGSPTGTTAINENGSVVELSIEVDVSDADLDDLNHSTKI